MNFSEKLQQTLGKAIKDGPKAAAWMAPVTGPAPAMELNWCANTVQPLVGT